MLSGYFDKDNEMHPTVAKMQPVGGLYLMDYILHWNCKNSNIEYKRGVAVADFKINFYLERRMSDKQIRYPFGNQNH